MLNSRSLTFTSLRSFRSAVNFLPDRRQGTITWPVIDANRKDVSPKISFLDYLILFFLRVKENECKAPTFMCHQVACAHIPTFTMFLTDRFCKVLLMAHIKRALQGWKNTAAFFQKQHRTYLRIVSDTTDLLGKVWSTRYRMWAKPHPHVVTNAHSKTVVLPAK